MFLIIDLQTGKHRISTAFTTYDEAVEALGGPAECNDWCSRNGCGIIWYDDADCIIKDHERTIVIDFKLTDDYIIRHDDDITTYSKTTSAQ